MRPESESSWQISAESLEALRTALRNNNTIRLNFNLKFTRPSPDGKKDPQVHSKTFSVDANSTEVLRAIDDAGYWVCSRNVYLYISSL